MTYANLDEMFSDLGLEMQEKRITYSLSGELNDSEVIARGVKPDSCYAEAMEDVVCGEGLLFDRSTFHGHGTVLIHSVEDA